MKALDVGQEALKAQGLVMQRVACRVGRRVGWFALALLFGLFMLISLHALLWAAALTVLKLSPLSAAFSVFCIDFLFVVVFALLGLRNVADPLEFEARNLRDRKLMELRQTLAISTVVSLLVGPVGRFTGRQAFKGLKNIFSRR